MNRNRRIYLLPLLLVFLTVNACGGGPAKQSQSAQRSDVLHIAAAANLSYVISLLIDAFIEEHGEYAVMDIRVTKASSGSLTAQIRNSAPFDVFLAANTGYPEALSADSLTFGSPVVYAEGIPAMVYRQEIDGEKGVACLLDVSVDKIALAKPELAPYGEAAVEILSRAGILKQVENKFVYGSSITQAFQHAITAADAGSIAASLLYGDSGQEMEKAGMRSVVFAPDAYNPAALRQAMVLLDSSNEAAQVFYSFMQGERAREILRNNGYRVE